MPTISMFYGIIISMYFNDHMPPHFHARYQGHEAAFTFDGELLTGNLPHKQEAMVRAWALIHSDELAAVWELAGSEGQIFKIDPLR